MQRRGGAAAFVLAVLLPLHSGGLAAPHTSAEVTALVRRATSGDGAALQELRSTTAIDGVPVDLGRSLSGVAGEDLDARLRALGVAVGAGATAPAEVRTEVDRILEQRRFRTASESFWQRLVRRLLVTLGALLGSAVRALGGPLVAGTATGGLVVVLTLLVALRLGRRRVHDVEAFAGIGHLLERGADPADLERRADAAAGQGAFGEAVRLRFVAGLIRLDRSGRIELAPGLTTHHVSQVLRSPRFDSLAATFDEIVYGGRRATAEDAEDALAGWRTILRPVEATR